MLLLACLQRAVWTNSTQTPARTRNSVSHVPTCGHPLCFMATARAAQVKGAAQHTLEKAKVVNEEHKVMDKAKAGASRAWGRIKEVGFDSRWQRIEPRSRAFSTSAARVIVCGLDQM